MSERELGMWKRDKLARYNENYNVLNKSNFSFKTKAKLRKNITEIGNALDRYLLKKNKNMF